MGFPSQTTEKSHTPPPANPFPYHRIQYSHKYFIYGYKITMLKLCTVLMPACAWIIIPLGRAEADGNST